MYFSDLVVGTTVSSDWFEVSQAVIQQFADATQDHQWIHLDEKRCKNESPFGCTIAHGFLTSSLMPMMFAQCVKVDPTQHTMLNYGVDTLRFLEPVRAGDRVKYHFELQTVEQKPSGQLFKVQANVSIDGRDKPALVGTFLMLLVGRD